MNEAAVELSRRMIGVTTALVTPMTESFSVDVGAFRTHVDYHCEMKVAALMACGTVGEFPTLTLSERMALNAVASDVARNRSLVLASVSSSRPSDVAALSVDAHAAGAGGFALMMPPFYELDEDEQWAFLQWFNASATIPFLLYVSRDAASAPPPLDLIERASGLEWFAGTKDATGDLERLEAIHVRFRTSIALVNASEPRLVEAALRGVTSAMTASACFAPRKVATALSVSHTRESALDAFHDILAFRSLFDPGPAPGSRPRYLPWTKAACEILGLPSGPPRPPLRALSLAEVEVLSAVLSKHFEQCHVGK